MNMISPIPEQNSRVGYVIVNTRTSRPLYFTGIFESIGRNMSAELEDAYVFGTRREAKAYQALNALVDDLDIQSYKVQRLGFGFRARQIANAILSNQRIQDIAGFASLCLFAVSAFVWLAIWSSEAESRTSHARHELVKNQQATVQKIGRDSRESTGTFFIGVRGSK